MGAGGAGEHAPPAPTRCAPFTFTDLRPLAPAPGPRPATVLRSARARRRRDDRAGRVRYVVRARETSGDVPVQIDRRVGSITDLRGRRRAPSNVWAEPVYVTHAVATPNDPLYPSQDARLHRPRRRRLPRRLGGRDRRAHRLRAPRRRSSPIVDSGVDVTHPDLAKNLWTNPGEIAGNEVDDDHNGFIDDVHGADIIAPGTPPDDEYYHGTAVAGVAAARGDDSQGVTGVAWVARIMAVRVLDENGVRRHRPARQGHPLRRRQRRPGHQRLDHDATRGPAPSTTRSPSPSARAS